MSVLAATGVSLSVLAALLIWAEHEDDSEVKELLLIFAWMPILVLVRIAVTVTQMNAAFDFVAGVGMQLTLVIALRRLGVYTLPRIRKFVTDLKDRFTRGRK